MRILYGCKPLNESARPAWALLAMAVAIVRAALAQELVTIPNPAPPAEAAGSRFGFSLAAVESSGILVGAPSCSPLVEAIFSLSCDPPGGPPAGPGVAYVFDQSGVLLHRLQAPSPGPAAGDSFGYSIAAVGRHVLVGAPYADVGGMRHAGAAFLFDGETGALIRTFTAPAPIPMDLFGYSVAAVGEDRIIVGAPVDDRFVVDGGAAYLFRATGELETILGDETPAFFDYFGGFVVSDGRRVYVGVAHETVDRVPFAGSVQIFDVSGRFRRTIPNPSPGFLDHFSFPVALPPRPRGGMLIGAPFNSKVMPGTGAAYLFTRRGALVRTFTKPTPPGSAAQDYFGPVAAVGPRLVLVGAAGDDASGVTDAGAAYLFARRGRQVFLNPSPAEGDWFGFAVASVGGHLVVGAPQDDTVATDAGAVYLWRSPSHGWARALYRTESRRPPRRGAAPSSAPEATP